jgi:hypothetical protein
MTDPPVLTETPEAVVDLALWWTENHSRYWKTRSLLLAHVGSEGPVRLPDGRLVGYMPDGNAWNGEGVATIMPTLIKNAEIRFTGDKEKVERLLSMALEELPGLDYEVKLTVDATAANAVIRAGGEAAEKLLPHRVARNKLGVRR